MAGLELGGTEAKVPSFLPQRASCLAGMCPWTRREGAIHAHLCPWEKMYTLNCFERVPADSSGTSAE